MDCPLTQTAPGRWRCPQCGWTYRGPRAPRRNCPAAPDAPTAAARVLADVLATDGLERDEATIRKLLAACEACPLCDAKIGCMWGHQCNRYGRWVKRLAKGQCQPWDDILGDDSLADDPPRVG